MRFKSYILACFLTLTLVGCSSQTASTLLEPRFSSSQSLFYDWGNINILGGTVSHTFKLQNTTSEPMILTGAVTSCMCTTAEIALKDGTVSPVFGMHDNDGWAYVVSPQEAFDVKVTFDPMAHGPDAVGVVLRTINVISDPDPKVQGVVYTRLDVQGNVLSEADYQQQDD